MHMSDKKTHGTLTDGRTDNESGIEGLSDSEDREKSIKALKDMYKRGLIPKKVYEQRLKDL